MKAGDIVGSILDPMQLFYKPKASGTKGAEGVEGSKDSGAASQLGPVTQLLAAVPGPLQTILGGVLK